MPAAPAGPLALELRQPIKTHESGVRDRTKPAMALYYVLEV